MERRQQVFAITEFLTPMLTKQLISQALFLPKTYPSYVA